MASTSAVHPTNGDDSQHIRLACQACQRKKIKCDRNFPCGQCGRSNLQCTPSTRKPRARHAGKRAIDSELRNRITKLETLVESLSGEVGVQAEDLGGEAGLPGDTPRKTSESPEAESAASPSVGKYIGSTFWGSLATEVQALKDALEEDQQEDEAEPTSPTTMTSGMNAPTANDYDLLICPPNAIYVMPGALNEPSPQMQSILYGTFIQNVAPMFKIFHIPTLRAFLERGEPYLGQEPTSLANRAVKASLWYAAINTISDVECQARFGQPRADLKQQYRRAADVLLAQADLMSTRDLAVVQAFVTTLIASRVADFSRRPWTMTALVVRIARAMGLHHESAGRTPFEAELRRRLWHAIRFLDVFTALDRASESLISAGSFDTPRPNNVNDSEFDESSTSITSHETGLTDMAFALLALEATGMTQRLNTPEVNPSGDVWQQRLEVAHGFGKMIQERYLQYCDMSVPFHRLVSCIAKSMSAGMILRAVRPIQPHVSSVPPRIDSPYVLQIAVDALAENEKIYEDPEAERWRWLTWVQWHPLAVALAGLCSIRGTELAEQAWVCVDKAYERHSRHVADTRNGMLWRPIEKLYKKAGAFRDAGRQELRPMHQPQTSADFPNTIPTTQPPQQSQLGHHGMAMGSMPMDPIMSGPMDFSNPDIDFSGMTPSLHSGDMSWLDWETIMNDFSDVPMSMGYMQQPQMLQNGQQWPSVLHNDLM